MDMVALPLALTGEYEEAWDGEFASVLIRLNGQPLLRLRSDDPVAGMYPGRREEAITDAINNFVAVLIRDIHGAEAA